MTPAASQQSKALPSTDQTPSPAKHPQRHSQGRRRDWTPKRVYYRTYGTRSADLAEVREHLRGWSANRQGSGSEAFIAVDAPGSHWIIGRCGPQFHAMRSVPGAPIDEASLVDGFKSAREAAEMIRQTDG